LLGGARTFGLSRVFLDECEGVLQGASFLFAENMGQRTSRVVADERGALHLYGSPYNLGGDWPLVRELRESDAALFDVRAMRAVVRGFELEFSAALADGLGEQLELYALEQCALDERGSFEPVQLRQARVSLDRRRVELVVDGLREEHLVRLRFTGPILSSDRARLWSSSVLYTLHHRPTEREFIDSGPRPASFDATLSGRDVRDGWSDAFPADELARWQAAADERLWTVTGRESVDASSTAPLESVDVFGDFELEFTWSLSRGAAGGVEFRAADDGARAPRYQLVDDATSLAARDPLRTAGANCDLHECAVDAALPAGALNRSRIVARRGHVEHWLNDIKVVEYELGGQDWSRRAGLLAPTRASRALRGRLRLVIERGTIAFHSLRVRALEP
jgi:hypothetical protein